MATRSIGAAILLFIAAQTAVAQTPGAWFCPATGLFASQSPSCSRPWLWIPEKEIPRRLRQQQLERDYQAQREAEATTKAAQQAEEDRLAAERQRAQKVDEKRQAIAAAAAAAAERGAERQRRDRIAKQTADDIGAGYKRMSLGDFLLDYRQMAAGTKVIVTGMHYQLGQTETLSGDLAGNIFAYVDSSGLSRETRKSVLTCHQRSALCRMTVWAHTGCVMTVAGHDTDAPCLVIDGLRGGTYEHPVTGAIMH